MQYYTPRGAGNYAVAALEVCAGLSLAALAHYNVTPSYTMSIGIGFALLPVVKGWLFAFGSEVIRRGVTMAHIDLDIAEHQQAGEEAAAAEAQGSPTSPWRGTLNADHFAKHVGGE